MQKCRGFRYKVSWLNYGALATFSLYRSLRSSCNEDVVVHSSINQHACLHRVIIMSVVTHHWLQLSAAATWVLLLLDSVVTRRSLKSYWWVQYDDDDDEATTCGPKYDDTSSYSTRTSVLRVFYEGDFVGLYHRELTRANFSTSLYRTLDHCSTSNSIRHNIIKTASHPVNVSITRLTIRVRVEWDWRGSRLS